MRKILGIIIIILLALSTNVFAQQKTAKVTLKNGSSFTGVVTELNPVSHVTIVIAGFENKISMSDVLSIEDIATPGNIALPNKKKFLVIEDAVNYPKSFVLKAGPYEIEMILVTGGVFSMGYDGDGSVRMGSEPIHDVLLNSFYVNKEPLSKDLVKYLKKGKVENSRNNSKFSPDGWKEAYSVVEMLAKATGTPAELITESQWEYVAVTQKGVFDPGSEEVNFCRDRYGDYPKVDSPLVNPTGPEGGRSHVARWYCDDVRDVYRRKRSVDIANSVETIPLRAIRFTIMASEMQ